MKRNFLPITVHTVSGKPMSPNRPAGRTRLPVFFCLLFLCCLASVRPDPSFRFSPIPRLSAVLSPARAAEASVSDSLGAVPPEAPGLNLFSDPAAGDPFPKVIDRINQPDAYPDFSFDGTEDLLEIWFPPIRDQDCAVFLYQDQVWMLDCGDERAEEETVPLLRMLGITQIDRMINTHPHHDHLNGLYAVDAAAPVRELLICFPEDATRHMTAAMEYCKGNGIPVTVFEDESVLEMGDGFVTFLAWQKSSETDTINNRSAQFMVTYGNCNMLFMADLEYQGEKQLEEALDPENLKADILRYPHHGVSRMVDSLFDAINPSLTVITNTSRIVELRASTKFLGDRHTAAAYTHQPGSVIHLQTDGAHWLCERVALPESAGNADDAENAENADGTEITDQAEELAEADNTEKTENSGNAESP